MQKLYRRIIVLVCVFLLIFMTFGVYATWLYMDAEPLGDHSSQISLGIEEFTWKPVEILPDDKEAGESHLALVEAICNNIKNGLNSSKGDRVCSQIKSNQIMYSQQNIQGGNLKHIFVTNENETQINHMEFVIEYVTDEFFYVYTFEDDDLEAGTPDVTYIEVYKTVLVKNGLWDYTETTYGNARIQTLSYRTINPATWTSGAPKNQTTN